MTTASELKTTFDEIFERRGGVPCGALVRWASTPRLGFIAGLARFLDDRPRPQPERDYGHLRLHEGWFPAKQAVNKLIGALVGSSSARTLPFGRFYGGVSVGRRSTNYSSNLSEWCEWWLEARIDSSNGPQPQAPSDPLVAHGLPPFGSAGRAIEEWLVSRSASSSSSSPFVGQLAIVIPDTRGVLSAVRWEGNKLKAAVKSARGFADLALQAVIQTDSGRVDLPEVTSVRANHEWSVPDDARSAEVFLVHKSRDFMGSTSVTPGARVKAQESALSTNEQAVRDCSGGENDRVEFKPFIEREQRGNAKWWEVAKTIVAFANTYGGRLYIGADDAGTPEGVEAFARALKSGDSDGEEQYIEHIRSVVRERLKPTPQISVGRVSVAGQPLFVVNVEAGLDRPYSTVNNEVFLRKGASDKLPDPQTELRPLYDRPAGAPGLLGRNVIGDDWLHRS